MAVAAPPSEMAVAALVERYRHYTLTVRSMSAETLRKRSVYLRRLFEFLGPPTNAGTRFARLDPKTIGAALTDFLAGRRQYANRFDTEPETLRLDQLDRDLILAFLDHLENDRQPPPSLALPEVNAILAVPDTRRTLGACDRVCPSLRGRTVTPHVFRHTTALHLIEAGNDIAVVKDWLGHADLKTTNAYLEVSLQRKRNALEKVPPPSGGEPVERPRWKQPKLMAFLSNLSRGVMVRPVRRKPHSSPASASTDAT